MTPQELPSNLLTLKQVDLKYLALLNEIEDLQKLLKESQDDLPPSLFRSFLQGEVGKSTKLRGQSWK